MLCKYFKLTTARLASVIVAAEGATFHDVPHFASGIVPGDGIFTTWSSRAGAARAGAFLLTPQPLAARTAHAWGVVAEVVPNGKALSRRWPTSRNQCKPRVNPSLGKENPHEEHEAHFVRPVMEAD